MRRAGEVRGLGRALGLGLASGLASGLALGCAPAEGPELSVARVAVGEDRFDDAQLNPGDQARVTVFVRNDGLEPEQGLGCAVVSQTPGVRLRTEGATLYLGFCATDCRADFRVEVDAEVAPGTEARFECLGEEVALRFSLPVVAPDLRPVVAAVRVVEDPTADGVLNPGEAARIQVALRNEGQARMGNSRCVVGSETPGIQINPNAEALGFASCAGGAECGAASFRLLVDPTVAPGTVAALSCVLVEDDAALVFPLAMQLGVEAPAARPRVDAVSVDQVGEGGLAPGGSGRVRVDLSNVGRGRLPAARCAVVSRSAWLRVNTQDGDLAWAGCAADAACRGSTFRVSVDAEAPPGGVAQLGCALEDELGAVWPLEFALPPLASAP